MAIVKPKKLREMSDSDVVEKMREVKLDLSKDRASSEIGTVKNPGRIREMRRTIARMLHEQGRRKAPTMKKKPAKAAQVSNNVKTPKGSK